MHNSGLTYELDALANKDFRSPTKTPCPGSSLQRSPGAGASPRRHHLGGFVSQNAPSDQGKRFPNWV